MELTHDQLAAVVRAEGVNLVEFNMTSLGKTYNSRRMCRCHPGDVPSTRHDLGGAKSRAWNPNGDVTVHITAGDLGSNSLMSYCLNILTTNPNAPLAANFGVGPDGTAVLLSAGRTNHALNSSVAARNAQDSDSLSLTSYQDLRGTGDDPKIRNYGIENINSRPLTTNPAQYETSVRICAAIARAYGRSGRNMIGHGEMASDRSMADPGINMGQFRRDVMARVAAGSTTPPPPATQKEWFDMATQDDLRQVLAESGNGGNLVLVRKRNASDGAVWLGDFMHRRWIKTGAELVALQWWMEKKLNLSTAVSDEDDLSVFGEPVGDLPPSGASGTDPLPA